MKKLSAILLVLAMLVTMLPVFSLTAVATGEEQTEPQEPVIPDEVETVTVDGVEYTVLRTRPDLAKLGTKGNYILGNDIDFGGEVVAKSIVSLPAGTVFDGNGYKFFNFSMNGSNVDLSLFGIANGAETVIRNLNIGSADAKIQFTGGTSSAVKSVGMILGYTNSIFRFQNIHVYADMTVTNANAGGLIGNCKGTYTLENCHFYGSITQTGGGKVGGLIGIVNTSTPAIKNCSNYGSITGASNVGGVVGNFEPGGTDITLTIEKCANYGTVKGTGQTGGIIGNTKVNVHTKIVDCRNYGTIEGSGSDSGAAIGKMDGSAYNMEVTGFANYGDMTGGNNKAGICGSVNGSGTLTVKNFLNTGNITSNSRVAGVTAYHGGSVTCEMEGVVILGNLSGKNATGGMIAMSSAKVTMKNCLFAGKLETTSAADFGALVGAYNEANVTAENNFFYTDNTSVNTHAGTALADMAAVLEKLNAEHSDAFGKFILNTEGTGVVQAVPKLSGIQLGKVQDGRLSVRLVATLQNSLRYERVGFRVNTTDGDLGAVSCRNVYLKLLGNGDGGQVETTAQSLGGSYLYALAINGVPAQGTVVLTVTAFAVDVDDTGVEYTGDTYELTFVDGVYQGAVSVNS